MTGPCPWGSHSQVNDRQGGEKTRQNCTGGKDLAPKPEKGPQGGELLTMQAVGLPGTGLSMDKSWGIRGK